VDSDRVIAIRKYILYLPDQQLPQIKPTFPPIFLAITRCAAIERSLLPAVNLISSVIDVLSRHVPVMGTVANDSCPPRVHYVVSRNVEVDCRGRRIGASGLSQQFLSSQLSDCSISVLKSWIVSEESIHVEITPRFAQSWKILMHFACRMRAKKSLQI